MKKVLNHGFVRLVDKMGDDSTIVRSARVSYGDGTKTKREDEKLIDYLLRNKHWTPFEMVVFTFHIKLPIFIARQWMRHRAGSYNEISARYSVMKDEFYVPDCDRIQEQSKLNKQCSGELLEYDDQIAAKSMIDISNQKAYTTYLDLIDLGVARELARVVLPVSTYTEFYWKVDLRNLFNFLQLRLHNHAQYEIRVYAEAINSIIEEIVPIAFQSFKNNCLH
jgi:thymidylate synthase (FAD)